MSPVVKMALTWVTVIAAVTAVFALRYEWVQGAFTSISEITPGTCRDIAIGLKGPEDFEIDAGHDAIFVSSLNRQAAKPNSDPHDGIYVLKLDDPGAAPVKLSGTPMDFHPHGVSLWRDAVGAENLVVIDHKITGRQMVEIYDVKFDGEAAKLIPQTTIQGGLLVSPNDVIAVGPDQFYVTNDHVTTTRLGRFAEDYLLWPHSDVMLYNGSNFRISTQRIALPNGVAVRGDMLYVTAMNERKLLAFHRQQFFGDLDPAGSLSIPARLDNVNLAPNGDLIVAGQVKPGSAQVFRVRLDGSGVPQSYETIFSDDGHKLTGASSAQIYNGHLFIGSARDSKMLECDIKQ